MIRYYEHVYDDRHVRVYPQADGSKSVWISNDNHSMTQLPSLLPVQGEQAIETVYRIDGRHDMGTERNMVEVMVRGFNRLQGVQVV